MTLAQNIVSPSAVGQHREPGRRAPVLNRVLVVDDDPIIRAIATSYFEDRGCGEILQAAHGHEALAHIETYGNTIDFLLCDLKMPEMDGVEVLRKLKEHAFTGAIAILSGENRATVDTAAGLAGLHELNIVGHLQKPAHKDELDQLTAQIVAARRHGAAQSALALSAAELQYALQAGHIVPYYQPKIDVSTQMVVGVEALARWIDPKLGLINPCDFIPLAEQNGLIGELTDVILRRSIDDLIFWRSNDIGLRLAVNFAPELLCDRRFPDSLAAQVNFAGLRPADITLEVTETAMLRRAADPLEVLTRLRLKGFGLSMDDFGTGYSNIDQLRKFPFSEMKIDRSFIQGADTSRLSKTIVETAMLLGEELDLELVAEGVESWQQWDFVADHGIDTVQGFLVAKPMPAEGFLKWHRDMGGRFAADAEPEDLRISA